MFVCKCKTNNTNSYSKPLFSSKALKLKALSGQILIVEDILMLANEECEKETKNIATSILTKEARTFRRLQSNEMHH